MLLVVANQLGLTLERLQLQREANEAEVLRRTDELRTALMNAVSHDLRTPLASIIASAGSLQQSDVQWTETERREFLNAIEQEAERLNRLVGNLLDLSRIEAGSLRPEMGWYDLGSLVEEVVGRLRFLTAAHEVSVEIPSDLPPIQFDYVEIDQVLTNLIENAIKYTPAGSEIRVTVQRSMKSCRSKWPTTARASRARRCHACSMRSSAGNRTSGRRGRGSAWPWRRGSLRRTAAGSGPRTDRRAALASSSHFRSSAAEGAGDPSMSQIGRAHPGGR